MTLTNRIVWFLFGGAWLRGRVTRDDPKSMFVSVAVDNDGPVYAQTVHKNDLYFSEPPGVVHEQMEY